MNNEAFLNYTFVLLLVSGVLFYLRRYFIAFLSIKREELAMLRAEKNTSINIQSYERMMIFLERLKPSNLVKKFDDTLAAHEFVFLTEKVICEEFDYNVSQQLYINAETWISIVDAKENLLRILKESYASLRDNTNLQDLKTIFLTQYIEQEDKVSLAICALKNEIKKRTGVQ